MSRLNAIAAALIAGSVLAAAPPLAAQNQSTSPEGPPFTFVVPLVVKNLHDNLTLVRSRCWVFPRDDWRSSGGALGEGISAPYATRPAGGVREFSGEVEVPVTLRDQRVSPAAARSYRCQLELYDATQDRWGTVGEIDARYPVDLESASVWETGGALPLLGR